MDNATFEELEPQLPARDDVIFQTWREALSTLSDVPATFRDAMPIPSDARRMHDIQVLCSPITPLPLKCNAAVIAEHRVLIAEIERIPVGFVLASVSESHSPISIQVVSVVPEVRGRGIGFELLSGATALEPNRNIALATQGENLAARAMNEKFAASIGAIVHPVKLGVYPDELLGFSRGQGYRTWEVRRG